jgi:hypothetical protein
MHDLHPDSRSTVLRRQGKVPPPTPRPKRPLPNSCDPLPQNQSDLSGEFGIAIRVSPCDFSALRLRQIELWGRLPTAQLFRLKNDFR